MTTSDIILLSTAGYFIIGIVIALIWAKMDFTNVVKDGFGNPVDVSTYAKPTPGQIILAIILWPCILLGFICIGYMTFVDWMFSKFDNH